MSLSLQIPFRQKNIENNKNTQKVNKNNYVDQQKSTPWAQDLKCQVKNCKSI